MRQAVVRLDPGEEVGPYEVVGHIARGGMAELYLGQKKGASGFDDVVVLKVMLEHLCTEARFSQMFVDEARVVSQLHHPNIVEVFDLGRTGEGLLFFAMEYLEGQAVAHLVKHAAWNEHPVPQEVAARVIADVARGLAYAHAAKDEGGHALGLVHRDVSPENLFVTYEGHTKILDFGVVKLKGSLAKTQYGELKGKIGYMAPEAVANVPFDSRADLFSLGIVLFEVLTARKLFSTRDPVSTLHRVLHADIPDVRSVRADVDGVLAELCMELLMRNPGRRLSTAEELGDRLEEWLATRNGSRHRVGDWLRRTFVEAHQASLLIREAKKSSHGVAQEVIEKAHRLGGGQLDESVVRELGSWGSSARNRRTGPDRPSAGAQAFSELEPRWAVDEEETEADAWVGQRRRNTRRLGLLVLVLALALAVWWVRQASWEPRPWVPPAYRLVQTLYESEGVSLHKVENKNSGSWALLRVWRVGGNEGPFLNAARDARDRIESLADPRLLPVWQVDAAHGFVFALMPWTEGRTLHDLMGSRALSAQAAKTLLFAVMAAVEEALKGGLYHGALDATSVWVTGAEHRVLLMGFQMGFLNHAQVKNREGRAPEAQPGPNEGMALDQYGTAALARQILRNFDQSGSERAAGVVARATAVARSRRYPDVSSFVRALEEALLRSGRR